MICWNRNCGTDAYLRRLHTVQLKSCLIYRYKRGERTYVDPHEPGTSAQPVTSTENPTSWLCSALFCIYNMPLLLMRGSRHVQALPCCLGGLEHKCHPNDERGFRYNPPPTHTHTLIQTQLLQHLSMEL